MSEPRARPAVSASIAVFRFIPPLRKPPVGHSLKDQRLQPLEGLAHGLLGGGSRRQLEAALAAAILAQGCGPSDQPILFHPQQGHPRTHLFGLAQGIAPAQVLAYSTRQSPPAQDRLELQQLPDMRQIRCAEVSSAITPPRLGTHGGCSGRVHAARCSGLPFQGRNSSSFSGARPPWRAHVSKYA